MSRIARVVAVNLPHHVTQRGNNRTQVFFDDEDRRSYLHTLARYRERYGVEVWAYCLMDNHVHFLAVPHQEDSLAKCFAGTNLVYTQYVNRKYNRCGRLWQNRFFSCPVDRDKHLWPVLRYIDRNPVRSGIVPYAWHYEWSSARHYVTGAADALLNEPDWLRQELSKLGYRDYLESEPDEVIRDIRLMTSTGRPFGSAAFLARLESNLGRDLTPRKPGRPRKATENLGSVPGF